MDPAQTSKEVKQTTWTFKTHVKTPANRQTSQAWWHKPLIPALGSQGNRCEFKASVWFTEPARATQ